MPCHNTSSLYGSQPASSRPLLSPSCLTFAAIVIIIIIQHHLSTPFKCSYSNSENYSIIISLSAHRISGPYYIAFKSFANSFRIVWNVCDNYLWCACAGIFVWACVCALYFMVQMAITLRKAQHPVYQFSNKVTFSARLFRPTHPSILGWMAILIIHCYRAPHKLFTLNPILCHLFLLLLAVVVDDVDCGGHPIPPATQIE